ncbi:MAG: hypothetical protein ACREHD_16140, partial [Pirellulales bacterium]
TGQSFGPSCPYCPYGFRNGRLVFENKETSSNELAPRDDLLAFFRANGDELDHFLEVSGGEPLLNPCLDKILGDEGLPGWFWAVTSNTLHAPMIRRLASAGALARCVCWTASYHPLSGKDELYASNIRLLSEFGVGNIRATVVVSVHTIEKIEAALDYLRVLPLAGYQFHVDSHGDLSKNPELRQRVETTAPDVWQFAGHVPQGRMCDRHAQLMAVGADGTLYECVTKAYRNLDPICKVNGSVLLRELPRNVDYCDVPSFAVCDHVKHVPEAVHQIQEAICVAH